MADARGRKETMYLASAVNVVGGALETGSVNMAMFLVSRFICGWGIGMMVVLIPIYQAEICRMISLPKIAPGLMQLQRHQMLVAFWSANTVLGSSWAMRSQDGWVQEHTTPQTCPFNGASPLHSPFCLHWDWHSALLGFQNHLDGVS